jgi:hypothetical protein
MLLLLLSWIMVGCVYFWAQIKTKKEKETMHVKNLLVLL